MGKVLTIGFTVHSSPDQNRRTDRKQFAGRADALAFCLPGSSNVDEGVEKILGQLQLPD